MFGHGRVCFLLTLPRRNLFLMGTVLHLLRSCIAGRGLWGKPFNGEIIPDGNTLVAALNSLKVRCSRVITASKPDGASGITCPLHKLLPKKNALVRYTSVCTIAARCERLQLGMPWRRCQSWPPFKSLPSRHTQNCSTLQSHHVRPWPSMFPPNSASQKFIPDGNSFAPLAFLHRRTRPVGKAFQRGNYSWWKHLGGSLEFVESALQPGDYCVKAGWRARDNLSLAQVASKKNTLVRSTSVCTIAARCERLQLGMPWRRCQSWPPFKSLPSRHTQNWFKIAKPPCSAMAEYVSS